MKLWTHIYLCQEHQDETPNFGPLESTEGHKLHPVDAVDRIKICSIIPCLLAVKYRKSFFVPAVDRSAVLH